VRLLLGMPLCSVSRGDFRVLALATCGKKHQGNTALPAVGLRASARSPARPEVPPLLCQSNAARSASGSWPRRTDEHEPQAAMLVPAFRLSARTRPCALATLATEDAAEAADATDAATGGLGETGTTISHAAVDAPAWCAGACVASKSVYTCAAGQVPYR
jgi:hypothetical protein